MSRPTDRLPYTPASQQRAADSGPPERRRLWPAITAAIALALALAFVWSNPKTPNNNANTGPQNAKQQPQTERPT